MTKSAPRKRKMLRARFPEGDERNFAANPYREQQRLDRERARVGLEALGRPAKPPATNDDPWCAHCGHARTDHPRDGKCGAALARPCRCWKFVLSQYAVEDDGNEE